MSARALPRIRPDPRPRWRAAEWAGVWIALLLTTGAVFPLVLMVQNGELGDAERARLRLLQLPVIVIAVGLLARHPAQLMLALRRTLPLVLLAALAMASTLWSTEPQVTLRRAIGLVITLMLAYLIAIRFSPRQILVLLASLLGVLFWASLLLALAHPSSAFMPDGSGLRGVFTHKNVLGWAACLGVVLAMGLIQDPARVFRRRGRVLLGTALACMLLSGSASSLFAAVVGLALFGFYRMLPRSRGLGRAILVLCALEFALLILVGLSTVLVPFLEFMGKDATLTGRVPLWELVDERIASRPWLGFGYQAFWTPNKREALAIAGVLQWDPPHAHNGYRDLMLNFGVVGAALFAATIMRAVRQAAVLHCAAPGSGWIWMNVMIGVMLTLNLTESNFLVQNDIQSLILLTIVIMVALRAPEAAQTLPDPVPRGAVAA